jgi:hypothetical protein
MIYIPLFIICLAVLLSKAFKTTKPEHKDYAKYMSFCENVKKEIVENFADDYRSLDNNLFKDSWNMEYSLNSEKLIPTYKDLNLKMLSLYCSKIEAEMNSFFYKYNGKKAKVIINKDLDIYKKIKVENYRIIKSKDDLREKNKYYKWEIESEIVFIKNKMFDYEYYSKNRLEKRHDFSNMSEYLIIIVKLLEDAQDNNKNIIYYKGDMVELYSIHNLKNLFEKYESDLFY